MRYFTRTKCLIVLIHLRWGILQHIYSMSFKLARCMLLSKMEKCLHLQGLLPEVMLLFSPIYLSEPTLQSNQLGKTLLHTVLPQSTLIRCTESSSDPRALALYIREGMRPQWPYFALRLQTTTRDMSFRPDVEIDVVRVNEYSELIRWDAQVSGRLRPGDSQFWMQKQHAIPLWFRRKKQIIGYGYVRLVGTLWYPHACTLGPIGVINPEDATACVLAAVHVALQSADVLRIDVPGPHPSLAPLLERGFRIADVDTFMSSATAPFFDPRCYIPSGGDLL